MQGSKSIIIQHNTRVPRVKMVTAFYRGAYQGEYSSIKENWTNTGPMLASIDLASILILNAYGEEWEEEQINYVDRVGDVCAKSK